MNKYGHVNFCEDLRHEANGLVTLVGCFNHSLVIEGPLPVMLPSIAMNINLYMIKSEPVSAIEILVFLPGDENEPALRVPIPANKDIWLDGKPFNERGEPIYIKVSNNLVFNGMVVEKEGSISVRGLCDGERVRLGRVDIKVANEENKMTPNIRVIHSTGESPPQT